MPTQSTSKKQSHTPPTQVTPCVGATYGQLTITEVRPDSLLTAKCKCGFPALVIPTDAWGLVLGCAACHAELAREAAEESEREARERERAERADREERRLRWLNSDPHYEELSKVDKRLFRHLADTFQFDVNSVANYLRINTEEAWDALLRLLDAHVIIERYKPPFPGVRPYSIHQNYAMGCSRSSTYSCRAGAIRQMEALELPEPVPVEETSVLAEAAEPTEAAVECVNQFVAEMCITGDGASESQIVLNAKYHDWCSDHQREALALEELGRVLDQIGYPARGGKRVGLRLRLVREMGGR